MLLGLSIFFYVLVVALVVFLLCFRKQGLKELYGCLMAERRIRLKVVNHGDSPCEMINLFYNLHPEVEIFSLSAVVSYRQILLLIRKGFCFACEEIFSEHCPIDIHPPERSSLIHIGGEDTILLKELSGKTILYVEFKLKIT